MRVICVCVRARALVEPVDVLVFVGVGEVVAETPSRRRAVALARDLQAYAHARAPVCEACVLLYACAGVRASTCTRACEQMGVRRRENKAAYARARV
eukprot:6212275-Pleurochrysis_carterae.AAC.2